jgi:hypothetical protein
VLVQYSRTQKTTQYRCCVLPNYPENYGDLLEGPQCTQNGDGSSTFEQTDPVGNISLLLGALLKKDQLL